MVQEGNPALSWREKNRLLNFYLMRVCLPAKYSSLSVGLSHAVIVHGSTSSCFFFKHIHILYMSKQPSNLQSDCFWLIEAELVTSFFALSVRHRRHNTPKKVMSLRRGSSLPLPTSLKLKPPVLCWTSLTENIKDLKSCNLRWICWWENLTLVLLWFSEAAFLNTFLMSNV